MKTGIELITEERKEQIEKHGFDGKHDGFYRSNELLKAALFCIDPDLHEWPYDWDAKFRDKIMSEDSITRFKKAGAFIAAHIDFIQRFRENQNNK